MKTTPFVFLSGLLFSSPSFSGATVINLGAEVGWSAAHNLPENGRHFAVRTSYVDMEWSKGSEQFMTPSKWKGMYARFERNPHDDRGVFGLGRSIGSDTLGLYGIEGGAVVSKANRKDSMPEQSLRLSCRLLWWGYTSARALFSPERDSGRPTSVCVL